MRWSGQEVLDGGVGAETALPGPQGLLRSVRTPEFAGAVFHEVEAKSVLNRVPGPSPMPFRWTINPHRCCSHAHVYCLAGPTGVLLADGRTRRIADLRVGDAVVGTAQVGGLRRYVRTTVLAHWATTRLAHLVRLAGGTELVAGGAHRFLTDQGWRHVTGGWCRSGRRPRLRPGSALLGPGPGGLAPRRRPTTGPDLRWPQRRHADDYRRGYLCGVVRSDGGGSRAGSDGPALADGVGSGFPSERLELEALGRVHHFLADAGRAPSGVPIAVGAGAWEPGRIAPPVRPTMAPTRGALAEAMRWPDVPDEQWCAGFLAGVLDARGIAALGGIVIELDDDQLATRVTSTLSRLGFRSLVGRRPGGGPTVRVSGGPEEPLRLLRVVDPAVSGLHEVEGPPVVGGPDLRVVDLRSLGMRMPMYDITTAVGDEVADGGGQPQLRCPLKCTFEQGPTPRSAPIGPARGPIHRRLTVYESTCVLPLPI